MQDEMNYVSDTPAVSTADGLVMVALVRNRVKIMPRRVAIALARSLLAAVATLEEEDGSRQHVLPFGRRRRSR